MTVEKCVKASGCAEIATRWRYIAIITSGRKSHNAGEAGSGQLSMMVACGMMDGPRERRIDYVRRRDWVR